MALFTVGKLVATPAALRALEAANLSPWQLLLKHAYGDFGLLDQEDVKRNEDAITYGDRILSKYKAGDEFLYVITEYDRSLTTILLCSEY